MWDLLFDNVYVLSLSNQNERRSYVAAHLSEAGLTRFQFHDGCGPDHPDVRALYCADKVHRFPPCFRCGKHSCGRDDCNNVLIPQQVAVFASYLALWRRIAASPQRALVLEDDVRLHDYWPQVLAQLQHWIEAGTVEFRADRPKLIRLGWALCAEHNSVDPARLSGALRMSNPAHALTSAMAQKALDRFLGVSTTADIFLHAQVPDRDEALTLFPPIASELSWSEGRFASLIHPKEVRADYLERNGQREAAEEAREALRHHYRDIAHRRS